MRYFSNPAILRKLPLTKGATPIVKFNSSFADSPKQIPTLPNRAKNQDNF